MTYFVLLLVFLAMLVAGLVGITLSVPLQAPTVIMMGVAGLISAVALLVRSRSGRLNGVSVLAGCDERHRWDLVICIMAILYFGLRACLSPVWGLGIEDLMLILPAGLLYLIAGYGVSGRLGNHLRMGLAGVVVLLFLLHMGSALMQFSGGEGYSLSAMFTSSRRASEGALTGMYGYRGSFANFAVIAALLCLCIGVWGRFPILFRACILTMGFAGGALAVIAQSRSAVVSLIAALIVFGCAMYISVGNLGPIIRLRIRITIMACMALSLIAAIAGGVMVFKGRATSGVSGVDVAFDSDVRYAFWSMAVEQWADYPIFGAGSRSYSYECFRYWNPNLPTHSGNPEFVHNEYLQLLADYGLIGFLLVIGILVYHLVKGFLRVKCLALKTQEGGLKKGSNNMALAIAGISGLTAMSVHICFDFRTHILSNLLLFVCCAVWVLQAAKPVDLKAGGRGGWKSRAGVYCLASVMMIMGLGTLGLGWQQLWAGLPLIQNRMAKEDGAWTPQQVDSNIWIPSLKKSLERMPQWRRYERLGTLYQIKAEQMEPSAKAQNLKKAEAAYLASIDLHPYNPIPYINLATMYSADKEWAKADNVYANISQIAVSREHWFRTYQKWGEVHRLWAKELWSEGAIDAAAEHYKRSQNLYHESKRIAPPHDEKWRDAYLSASFEYAYFLLSGKNFRDALDIVIQCEKEAGRARVLRLRADYLLYYAEFLWFKRKPEEAMRYLYDAHNMYLACKRWNKEAVDDHWHANFKKTKKIIGFLKAAGVKRSVDKQKVLEN